MKLTRLLKIMALVLVFAATDVMAEEPQFVGSETCHSCHKSEFSAWQQSDHFKSMQLPSEKTVLGDFNNIELEFHGITSRFFKQDKQYKVSTTNIQGEKQTFVVSYTFGYSPLQQYLLDIGEGKLQAFNIAWDSRTAEQGGQRWFHLQPTENISPKHPFFWQRHFQNWNGRCADCHSTNLQKNYDVANNSFDTTFSEINVACESCHGAGSKHVDLAKSATLKADLSGFSQPLVPLNHWTLKPGKTIAESTGEPFNAEIDMCGKCHSLHTPIEKDNKVGGFFDKNRIEWVRPPFYNDNGLIKEEVFVLGSFLQSKMYQAGVTCSNCHNAHTGKVKTQGNGLCLQCHQSSTYNVPEHHQHVQDSAGAMCVTCHMPEKTYMGVDDRRDHSFSIPNFEFEQQSDEPQVCLSCHDKDNKTWRAAVNKGWDTTATNTLKNLHHKIAQNAPDAVMAVEHYIQDKQQTSIRKGTLLSELGNTPSQQSVNLSVQQLSNLDPFVRRAAAESLSVLQPADRWQILKNSLAENDPAVRFAMAQALVEALPLLTAAENKRISDLINEYRYMLNLSAESPIIQLGIANLEWYLGNQDKAEKAYLQAVKIEPSYITVLIQVAEFYRKIQQDPKGMEFLQQALVVEPDNAQANHALGLLLIRQKRYQEALSALKMATDSHEAIVDYAYIYAIALDNQKQTFKAIDVLVKADKRWPGNNALVSVLVAYLNKVGKGAEAQKYLH